MILKAIHNALHVACLGVSVASHHANLWFWKQFTTVVLCPIICLALRVITQTYDFESNSQLMKSFLEILGSCESSRKPMILKAIHNYSSSLLRRYIVASHHANLWFWKQFTTQKVCRFQKTSLRVITQTYDFESNSQLLFASTARRMSCESSRKPMILKAIHNFLLGYVPDFLLRVITQTYDFESNSQLLSKSSS